MLKAGVLLALCIKVRSSRNGHGVVISAARPCTAVHPCNGMTTSLGTYKVF